MNTTLQACKEFSVMVQMIQHLRAQHIQPICAAFIRCDFQKPFQIFYMSSQASYPYVICHFTALVFRYRTKRIGVYPVVRNSTLDTCSSTPLPRSIKPATNGKNRSSMHWSLTSSIPSKPLLVVCSAQKTYLLYKNPPSV